MFCPNCGSQIDPDLATCPNCGAPLESNAGTRGESNVIAIIGLVLSFFSPIIGLVLSIIGLRHAQKSGVNRGVAIAGIVISALLFAVQVVAVVLVFTLFLDKILPIVNDILMTFGLQPIVY